MWKVSEDIKELEVFKKHAKVVGIALMIIGFLGALFPIFATLTTVMFVAWMLFFSAFFVGYSTYKTDKTEWRGWLKAFIFFIVGAYMIFFPLGGIATLGLLFSIYFFMDAFSGFALALSFYPNKGFGIWIINALLSLVISVMFLMNWPQTSILLIGLLVGFSLFFDGLALFMGANIFGKWIEKYEK